VKNWVDLTYFLRYEVTAHVGGVAKADANKTSLPEQKSVMRTPSPSSCFSGRIMLSSWDAAWILASPLLALYLRDGGLAPQNGWESIAVYWLITAGFSVLAMFAFRIPDSMMRYFTVHDALDIYKAAAVAELVTCVVLFTFTRLDGIPRSMPLIHGMLLATGLAAARLLFLHYGENESTEYHISGGRVILIGANRVSAFFIKMLNAYPPEQQRVVGILDDRPEMAGRAISGVRIVGGPDRLGSIIDEFSIHGVDIEKVIVAGEGLVSQAALLELERVCGAREIDLCFLPRMLGVSVPRSAASVASVLPAREVPSPALPSYFVLKRWIDVIGSLALIVLLFPFLLIGTFLALLDVGSPILFWQERLGRNGRSFLIYKFRTLRSPFDQDGNPILENRRLSGIGRFLRASHIDELPQLLNVLIGDMSLIGPRPLLPADQPSSTKVRLLIRPGITGWAQVNGGKLVTPEEKQKLDEWYVRSASLWIDIYIALMTLKIVLRSAETSEESLADAEQAQTRNVVNWQTFAMRRDVGVRMAQKSLIPVPEQPSARLSRNER
jgi:lipopolysaccharide/colanic/teichoic acid biosynthesis glycosyltransferase